MISLSEYSSYDGLGLAQLVARKELTAEELVNVALQAIEKVNPKAERSAGYPARAGD